jgi:hypothetical protein
MIDAVVIVIIFFWFSLVCLLDKWEVLKYFQKVNSNHTCTSAPHKYFAHKSEAKDYLPSLAIGSTTRVWEYDKFPGDCYEKGVYPHDFGG